jgi:hypothetical protein
VTSFPVLSGTEIQLHLPAVHYNRVSSLLPSQGLCLTVVSWRSLGRIPIHFSRRGFSRSGQGTRFYLLAQVCLVPSDRWLHIMNSLQVPRDASGDGMNRLGRYGKVLIRVSVIFFEAENIVVLTMLLSRYKVEVEEPEFIGETFEQRYARMTRRPSSYT